MLRTAVDRLLKNDALRCAKGAISTLSRSPLIACKSSVCVCDHVIRQALAPSLFHDPPRCWRIAGSWAPAEPVAETAASPSPPRPMRRGAGPRRGSGRCARLRARRLVLAAAACVGGGVGKRRRRRRGPRARSRTAPRVSAPCASSRATAGGGGCGGLGRGWGGGAATTSTRLATALPQL